MFRVNVGKYSIHGASGYDGLIGPCRYMRAHIVYMFLIYGIIWNPVIFPKKTADP